MEVSHLITGWDNFVDFLRSPNAPAEPISSVQENVKTFILSTTQSGRLSALKVLLALRPTTNIVREVLVRCIAAEDVTLNIHGVRERSMKIQKLPFFFQGQTTSDDLLAAADITGRWLISMSARNSHTLKLTPLARSAKGFVEAALGCRSGRVGLSG